ncbi:hypothetical protein FACS18949_09820 [Clostridia bacterium]|nr:hypothetical protein FACS18949_09820 [Clostridia bacterium]
MSGKHLRTIEETLGGISAAKMIKSSFSEFSPRKGNILGLIISFIVGILLSVFIAMSPQTVELATHTIEIAFNIILPIFVSLITVYAILLSFLNEHFIEKLSEIDYKDGRSQLINSIEAYEHELFLYFIALALSGIVRIVVNFIPLDFTLTANHLLNNVLAMILLTIYLVFVARVFYELKSVLFNTIFLFRANVSYKLLHIVEENNKKSVSDDTCK